MSDRKPKQKKTGTKKAKKNAKTAIQKGAAKKQAPKSTQETPKTVEPVPEVAGNVPGKSENVPEKSTYRQQLNALPNQRARFVEEYLIDLNPTAAAKRAGYSAHTADRQSSRLLKYAEVRAAVDAGKAEISEQNKDRFEEAMEELRILAFSDIQNYITVDSLTGAIQCKGFEDMPDRSSRAIESIQEDRVIKESNDGTQIILNDKRKFKLHNKVTALVAYLDRIKPPVSTLRLTGADGGPIKTVGLTDDELLAIARGGGPGACKKA